MRKTRNLIIVSALIALSTQFSDGTCVKNSSPSNFSTCNPGQAATAYVNFQDQNETQQAYTYCLHTCCFDNSTCKNANNSITTGCTSNGSYTHTWQETYTSTAYSYGDKTCTGWYNYTVPVPLNAVDKGEWQKYIVDGTNCGG